MLAKVLLIFTLLFSSLHADKTIFFKILKNYLFKNKKPINYHLKNKIHPKTKVKFDKHGYPLFKAVDTCDMRLSWYEINFDKLKHNTTIRNKHFFLCSKKLYKKLLHNPKLKKRFSQKQLKSLRSGKTPDGYTWHHEPKKNILTLVDRQIHSNTAHSGGFSLFH